MFIILFFLSMFTTGLHAQSWQEEMDSVLTLLERQDIFDGQLLIAEGGQVLFNQAYGQREDNGEITKQTALNVESVGKIITSAAVPMASYSLRQVLHKAAFWVIIILVIPFSIPKRNLSLLHSTGPPK